MKTVTGILLITALFVASSVNARQGEMLEYARVIDAVPVYADVVRSEPQRECWTETVRYEYPQYQQRSATPKIVGALIGAALGNNIAHGRYNRHASSAAGAILGASIGADIARNNAGRSTEVEYRDEQRCEVTERTYTERVVVGYDVSYEYQGRIYRTRMDQHPGKRIKVAVDVRPVY